MNWCLRLGGSFKEGNRVKVARIGQLSACMRSLALFSYRNPILATAKSEDLLGKWLPNFADFKSTIE